MDLTQQEVQIIRAGRMLLGWKQTELAAKAGLSASTLKRIEGPGKIVKLDAADASGRIRTVEVVPTTAGTMRSIFKAMIDAGLRFDLTDQRCQLSGPLTCEFLFQAETIGHLRRASAAGDPAP